MCKEGWGEVSEVETLKKNTPIPSLMFHGILTLCSTG